MENRKVSCGCLIFSRGRMLLAKPSFARTWDIPKGVAEVGECHLAAVLREVREETGIDIGSVGGNPFLIDMGVMKYLPEKDLRLYAFRGSPDLSAFELFCAVSVDDGKGGAMPEICEYAWVEPMEASDMVGRNMGAIIRRVLPEMDGDFWAGDKWPSCCVPTE